MGQAMKIPSGRFGTSSWLKIEKPTAFPKITPWGDCHPLLHCFTVR
jgi:hypothetical protein